MTRPIEYRIFDKKKNEYLESPGLILISLTGKFLYSVCGQELNRDDYIIEQSTGLLDCKKKEIYEGDILKRTDSSYADNRIIEWGFHSDHSSYKCQLGFNLYEDESYEVIGNIHQNPKLLK